MPDSKMILLSAGGTGGHLFPAEALAEELLKRGQRVTIVTDKRGYAFKSLGDAVRVYTVRSAYLKAGLVAKMKAVVDIVVGVVQSMTLLREIKPDVVVGFGGYPSFPAVMAAQLLGIPTVLHEQNAVLGKANAVLAARAKTIAASLPETRGAEKYKKKTVVTGNPLRAAIVAAANENYAPSQGDFRVFITGGSQAASVFADVVPDAVTHLPEALRARLLVVHQCREAEISKTDEKYKAAGVRAEVKAFFTDMPEQLKKCHFFIGRSGASTVAEIAVMGVPALFVPLYHKDMQQKFNAEVVSGRGGGWTVAQSEFTPDFLSTKLTEVMQAPQILVQAAAAAKACGNPTAAKNLADVVLKA